MRLLELMLHRENILSRGGKKHIPAMSGGKVLHVINSLNIGGAENMMVSHIDHLTREFPELGNEVCILGDSGQIAVEYRERLPVTPYCLGFSGVYRNILESIVCVFKLRKLIRKVRPDIIHSYLWNSDVFASLAAIGLPVKRVSHVVDRRGGRNRGRWTQRLRIRGTGWLLRRHGGSFAAVSEACRNHVIAEYLVPKDRVVTAYNGIDPNCFSARQSSAISSETVTIGSLGRFVPEKGFEYLVEAFEIAVQQRSDLRLVIAGEGRTYLSIQEMIQRKRLENCILLVGKVISANEFYRGLNIFVVPSVMAEGLPTTILEAMATGLPVIATDLGGAGEVIEEGKTGLLVSPGDSVQLADAMLKLSASPGKVLQMGEAANSTVLKHFTVKNMTKTIVEQVYRPLIVVSNSE